jgi:hypothetical protein
MLPELVLILIASDATAAEPDIAPDDVLILIGTPVTVAKQVIDAAEPFNTDAAAETLAFAVTDALPNSRIASPSA